MRELARTMQLAYDYRITNLPKTLDTANIDDFTCTTPLRLSFEKPLGEAACRSLFVATNRSKSKDRQDLEDNLLHALAARDEAHRWPLVCVLVNAHGLRLQFMDIETYKLHEYLLGAGTKDIILRIHAIDQLGIPRVYLYHEHTMHGQHLIGVQEPSLGEGGLCQSLCFTLNPHGNCTDVTIIETI